MHLLKTCARARRSRDDVAGKAATPTNPRHRERTANRDLVANISWATVRRLVRGAEGKYTLLAGNGFGLASSGFLIMV